jgi:hypothetical protein
VLQRVRLKLIAFLHILWLPIVFAASQKPFARLNELPKFNRLAAQVSILLVGITTLTKIYIYFEVERRTSWVIDSGRGGVCSLLSANIGCLDSKPTGAVDYNVDGHKAIDAVLALFATIDIQQRLVGFSPESTMQTIVSNVITPWLVPLFSIPAVFIFLEPDSKGYLLARRLIPSWIAARVTKVARVSARFS